MANKSLTDLFKAADALVPEAMAPHITQLVNARIGGAITVEQNLPAVAEQFLEAHHGKNLVFNKTRDSANPLRTVSSNLAKIQAYRDVGLEPLIPGRHVLVVAPSEGEIRKFGNTPGVDFLPFFHCGDGEGPGDALLIKAFTGVRPAVAADPFRWSSYRLLKANGVDTSFSPYMGSRYEYVGNEDFFRKYCEAMGQDLGWSSKHYDAVLVTERAAAYMDEQAWLNLGTLAGAPKIYYYSPFVPEVVLGHLAKVEVYKYTEYNKSTGVNVMAPRFNVVDATATYPIHHKSSAKKDIDMTLASLVTGNRNECFGTIAWLSESGSRPGGQFTAPLSTWNLLSGTKAITVQYDRIRFTEHSHMMPCITYDNGTYIVGTWTVTRQPWQTTLIYTLPRYRHTVRIPAVSKLTALWHDTVENQDIEEHEARTALRGMSLSESFNIYCPADFYDNIVLYVQRVASKVRDDPDFLSSVVGYGAKMLGGQSMVGALALSAKTFNVDAKHLLDIGFSAIQMVKRDLLKIRKLSADTGLWNKLKTAFVRGVAASFIGDFLDWLYAGKQWVEYLPTELNVFVQGGNLGLKIRTPPMPQRDKTIGEPEAECVPESICVETPSDTGPVTPSISGVGSSEEDSEDDTSVLPLRVNRGPAMIERDASTTATYSQSESSGTRTPICEDEDSLSETVELDAAPVVQSLLGSIGRERDLYRWVVNGRPGDDDFFSDMEDTNYTPSRPQPSLMLHWSFQAKQEMKRLPHSEWVYRSTIVREVDRTDPILTFFADAVSQVVMTKHHHYAPTPVTFDFAKTEIDKIRASVSTTLKGAIPSAKELANVSNALERAVGGYGLFHVTNPNSFKFTVPNVIILEGGPGCGKSYAARRFMMSELIKSYVRNKTVQTFNVLVPVNELLQDYNHIYLKGPGDVDVTGTVIKKTLHKSVEFSQCDYLFVDEFYLVGAEFLYTALRRTQPKYLIMMGDSLQNHIMPEHGTPIMRRWPELANALHYRMCVNFRNPPGHVKKLSEAYCKPRGLFMLSGVKDDPKCGHIFTSTDPISTWQAKDVPCSSALPSVCHKNGEVIQWITITNPDKITLGTMLGEDPDFLKTSRAMQGKTFYNVGVVMTASATALLRNVDSQALVAFSRHRGNLYIVHPLGDMAFFVGNIAATLHPMGGQAQINAVIDLNVAGFPVSAPSDKMQPAPAVVAFPVKMEYGGYDAYAHLVAEPDPNCANITEIVASLPYDPNDLKKDSERPYKVIPPVNSMYGNGGKLLDDWKQIRQLGDSTVPIMSQTAGAFQTARTAVGRFTKRPQGKVDGTAKSFATKLVDSYFEDCKDLGKLKLLQADLDLFNLTVANWLSDAKTKNYFKRLFGSYNGVVDLDMAALHTDQGVAVHLERYAVHLSQKAQVKAVNQQKGLNPEKVGQPIAAADLKVVITYAILCRYITALDMLSSKTNGPIQLVEHNGRDVSGVQADIEQALRTGGSGLNLAVATSDIEESDIRCNKPNHWICIEYWTRLVPWIPVETIETMLAMYGSEQQLSSARLSIMQAYQNLSGVPWTLLFITTNQKVVNHYLFPWKWSSLVCNFRLESNIGDDAIIIQEHMQTESFGQEVATRAAYIKAALGMVFKTSIVGTEDSVEFVGHVVALRKDGTVAFTPSLSRRLKRFMAIAWPLDDEKAQVLFYARQQALRDYFTLYAEQKEQILKADANLLFNDAVEDGLPEHLQRMRAYNHAEAIWNAFLSLAHVKFEQFKVSLRVTEQWTNVRMYVRDGLMSFH